MKEELVTFETARLAREKGFNIPCRAKINSSHYHFVENNIIPKNIGTSENEMFAPIKDWNNLEEPDHYRQQVILKGLNTSLPTQSLLQRWLREVHNIDCFPQHQFLGESACIKYTPLITTSINDIDSEDYCNYSFEEIYDTYEQAFEFGLQKALKLIKIKITKNNE